MHTLVEGRQTLIGECRDNEHRESEFDSLPLKSRKF